MPTTNSSESHLRADGFTPTARPWRWWLGKLIPALAVLVAGLLAIAALGVAQRFGWISAGGESAAAAPEDAVVYTCSMHPQIRQPGPGRCPICLMELVPVSSAAADLDEYAVRIEPAQRRLAQIETAPVRREPLTDTLQSIGAVAIDESRQATISSYIAGRVERLFADYTGVDVAKGDHLAVVYSPQLYAAQVEYLQARRSLASMTSATMAAVRQSQTQLVESARHRLVELGMTEEQLQALERSQESQSRLTIYAPVGGTVIEKLVREGDYLSAGDPIYRIANLSTVWLMLELFPEDASRIRFGQTVDATFQSLPGERFQGRVAFIDPTVDPQKRTVGVRVEFLNNDGRLRPGDFATATIHLPIGQQGDIYDDALAGKWISPMHPQIIRDEPGNCPICGMELVPSSQFGYSDSPVPQPASLFVPRSAVLMAGNNSVVYVEEEAGRFEIRPVTIGPILRDRVVIVAGLREGEHVATAGNFLIDSQMQLAGKPSLIDPGKFVAEQERKGPLKFDHVHVAPVAGETGEILESMYSAYFEIRSALASDELPPAQSAVRLHQLATRLAESAEFTSEARSELQSIALHSDQLQRLDMEQTRLGAFRPVSHAVTKLAAQVRGDRAAQPFYHMFCPMVKGGGGDWIQQTPELRNPYFGSQMLTCGELVHTFPASGHSGVSSEANTPSQPRPQGGN